MNDIKTPSPSHQLIALAKKDVSNSPLLKQASEAIEAQRVMLSQVIGAARKLGYEGDDLQQSFEFLSVLSEDGEQIQYARKIMRNMQLAKNKLNDATVLLSTI